VRDQGIGAGDPLGVHVSSSASVVQASVVLSLVFARAEDAVLEPSDVAVAEDDAEAFLQRPVGMATASSLRI